MSCWKCGQELPNPGCPECAPSSAASPISPIYSPPPSKPAPIRYDIDWDKVKSIHDLKMIMSVFMIAVEWGTPCYYKLQKYLKPHQP